MPRQRSDIDQRIVRAATNRFLTEGVDGSSLRSIAADAATNVGMIYYYFPTKDDLFLAVVESAYARLLDDLTQVLSPEKPVRKRLEGVYQRLARMSAAEFDVIRIIVREAMISSSRLRKLFARFSAGHLPLLFGALQSGLDQGTFRQSTPLPALLAAIASTSILPQLAHRRISAELPSVAALLPGPEALAAALFAIVMDGATD